MQIYNPVENFAASVYAAINRDLPDIRYPETVWDRELKRHVETGEIKLARPRVDEVEIYSFPQTWGSTALGFGGIGGSAMTTAMTVVVISYGVAAVYFAGRHAYTVSVTAALMEAIQFHNMPSVASVGKLK